MPALILDGQVLTESAAIAMHLADLHPEAGLAPAIATPARAAYYRWMFFCAYTLMPAYRSWFYADEPGLRNRELALVGVALKAASPTEDATTAAGAAIGELRRFLASVGQRHRLASLGFDDAGLDIVAQDAIDDVAIRNSPRLPTLTEARGILATVA